MSKEKKSQKDFIKYLSAIQQMAAQEGFNSLYETYVEHLRARFFGEAVIIGEARRVILREIKESDLEALYEFEGASLETILEAFLKESYEASKSYLQAYIDHMYPMYDYGIWAVELKETGEMIGDLFDLSQPESSYFDYHFILPQKMFVNDCFEANKTKILKQYRFPEEPGMRFVPEAWMFDQIGVEYKLLLTNEVFRYVEYLEDGITKDNNFKQKNARGFLYHYISRIENVLPKKKLPLMQSVKLQVGAWYRYWQCVQLDKEGQGPRIQNIALIGYVTKLMYPLLSRIVRN